MENRSCENCYHNDICHSGSHKKCNTMEHENFLSKNAEPDINIKIAKRRMFNSIRDVYKKLSPEQFRQFICLEMNEAFEYAENIMKSE